MPAQPKRKRSPRTTLPPRGKAAKVPQSRRRDIVDQALLLMEDKGFAAVSVQHLADALEFSKANFYHHVESKEKLLYEIFVEVLQSSLERIESIVDSADPFPDKLRALIEFYVSLMTERRAVMLVWFKERAHLQGKHEEEVGKLERQLGVVLRRFYAGGIAQGSFKPMDPELLRQAVFGMCFMLTKSPQPIDRASIAGITRQLQDFASAGLLTP
jgi:AcrR family transcriptional regulator